VTSAAFSPEPSKLEQLLKGRHNPGLGADEEVGRRFREDQKIVSASYDKTVRVWDAATGDCEQTMTGHTNWVLSAAFSPEGQKIVSASADKTVRIWDAATGDCEQTMTGHTS
jgi:WD40 repeat protein